MHVTESPPPLQAETTDLGHLELIAIFHYIVGALTILSIGFFALHYKLMTAIMNNPEHWNNQPGTTDMPAMPEEFFAIMLIFYGAGGLISLIAGILLILSGRYIQQLRNRTYSIVIAAISCIFFPFGTILGIFTLIKLSAGSVQSLYKRQESIEPYNTAG